MLSTTSSETSLNYSYSSLRNGIMIQSIRNYPVSRHELIHLTDPLTSREGKRPHHTDPLSACITSLSCSLCLSFCKAPQNCVLSARWDAVPFMNHQIKPTKSLHFIQLNFVFFNTRFQPWLYIRTTRGFKNSCWAALPLHYNSVYLG